jgi:hypothetical protein
MNFASNVIRRCRPLNRRTFFTSGLKNYLLSFAETLSLSAEDEQSDYFASIFSCYPLLAEAPMDQLIEAAKQLGVDPENKTKLELAREVFSGKQGNAHAPR